MDFKTEAIMAFQVRTTETLMGKAPSRIDQSLGDGNRKSLKNTGRLARFCPQHQLVSFFFGGGGSWEGNQKTSWVCFFSGFLFFVFLCKKTSLYLILARFPIFWTPLQPAFFFLYLESMDDVFLSSHGVDQLFMVGILSEIRILCLHFQGTGWRAISKRFQMWLGRWKR